MKAPPASLAAARPLVVALDYDGTLVPIARHHEGPYPTARQRRLLRALAARKDVRLVFVTGRAVADIRRRASVPGAAYIGNHGLEAADGRWGWTHPAALRARPIVRRLSKALEAPVARTKGAALEDKGITLSIHYRQVRSKAALRRLGGEVRAAIAEAERRRGRLRILHGKKVWNIKPDVGWNKGLGLLHWRDARRVPGTVVFLGDDRTDEEGFRALGPRAVSVRIGPGRTCARHRLRQAHVDRFLRAVTKSS